MSIIYMLTGEVYAAASLIVGQYDAQSTFTDNTPQEITFAQAFEEAPVVFALTTDDGGDSALIRVFDVTTSGFKSIILEPESFDGQHVQMNNVTYIAVAKGEVVLPDGTVIHAGTLDINDAQGNPSHFTGSSYEAADYDGHMFMNDPTLITGLQTIENAVELPGGGYDTTTIGNPFLSVATDNVTNLGFDVALERLETGTGDVGEFGGNPLIQETVGWLAVEQGTGSFSNNGTTILYDFSVFNSAVDGWDNGGETLSFNQTFTDDDVLVGAQMNTRNGNNGGFIRRGDIDADGIQLFIDEDTNVDSERSHTDETVSIAAFSSAFVYVPEPNSFVLFLLSLVSVLFIKKRPLARE